MRVFQERKRVLAALLFCAALAPGILADGTPPRHAETGLPAHTLFGVRVDYPLGTGLEEPERDFALAARYGLDTMCLTVAWRDCEFARGLFLLDYLDECVAAAVAHGITLIASVSRPPRWANGDADLARFLRMLIARYRGRIRYWELAGDLAAVAETGDRLAGLVSGIARAVAVVKEVEPGSFVIAGCPAALASSFAARLREEGVADRLDAICVHYTPETSIARQEERLAEEILLVTREIAARGGPQLWITWAMGGDHPITAERFSAEGAPETSDLPELWRAIGPALSTGRVSAFLWPMTAGRPVAETAQESRRELFYLLAGGGFPTPVWFGLAVLRRIFADPYQPLEQANQADSSVYTFAREDGSIVLLAWARTEQAGRMGVTVPGAGYTGMALTGTGRAERLAATTVENGRTSLVLLLKPGEPAAIELFPRQTRIPPRLTLSAHALRGEMLILKISNPGQSAADDVCLELLSPHDRLRAPEAAIGSIPAGGTVLVGLSLLRGGRAGGLVPVWVTARAHGLPPAALGLAINLGDRLDLLE